MLNYMTERVSIIMGKTASSDFYKQMRRLSVELLNTDTVAFTEAESLNTDNSMYTTVSFLSSDLFVEFTADKIELCFECQVALKNGKNLSNITDFSVNLEDLDGLNFHSLPRKPVSDSYSVMKDGVEYYSTNILRNYSEIVRILSEGNSQ